MYNSYSSIVFNARRLSGSVICMIHIVNNILPRDIGPILLIFSFDVRMG